MGSHSFQQQSLKVPVRAFRRQYGGFTSCHLLSGRPHLSPRKFCERLLSPWAVLLTVNSV